MEDLSLVAALLDMAMEAVDEAAALYEKVEQGPVDLWRFDTVATRIESLREAILPNPSPLEVPEPEYLETDLAMRW